MSPEDCGCEPYASYVAGCGWTENHSHPVRGAKACPCCAETWRCRANQAIREREQRWASQFLGTDGEAS